MVALIIDHPTDTKFHVDRTNDGDRYRITVKGEIVLVTYDKSAATTKFRNLTQK